MIGFNARNALDFMEIESTHTNVVRKQVFLYIESLKYTYYHMRKLLLLLYCCVSFGLYWKKNRKDLLQTIKPEEADSKITFWEAQWQVAEVLDNGMYFLWSGNGKLKLYQGSSSKQCSSDWSYPGWRSMDCSTKDPNFATNKLEYLTITCEGINQSTFKIRISKKNHWIKVREKIMLEFRIAEDASSGASLNLTEKEILFPWEYTRLWVKIIQSIDERAKNQKRDAKRSSATPRSPRIIIRYQRYRLLFIPPKKSSPVATPIPDRDLCQRNAIPYRISIDQRNVFFGKLPECFVDHSNDSKRFMMKSNFSD